MKNNVSQNDQIRKQIEDFRIDLFEYLQGQGFITELRMEKIDKMFHPLIHASQNWQVSYPDLNKPRLAYFEDQYEHILSDTQGRIDEENIIIPSEPKQPIKKKSEQKNILQYFGNLFKNLFESEHSDKIEQNFTISEFLRVRQDNQQKHYTKMDILKLYSDPQAKAILKTYLKSRDIVFDMMKSKKKSNFTLHIQYIKKLFQAADYPQTLKKLKLNM